MEKKNALGRRKSAVARVYLASGKGNITINDRPLEDYFKGMLAYQEEERKRGVKFVSFPPKRIDDELQQSDSVAEGPPPPYNA